MPESVNRKILNFGTGLYRQTSSEDEQNNRDGLPKTSDIRVFTGQKPTESTGAVPKATKPIPEPQPKRKRTLERSVINQTAKVAENMDTITGEGASITPKKFSTNFVNILKEKAARSIKVQNKFQPLSDTDSDEEDTNTQKPPLATKKPKARIVTKNNKTDNTETTKNLNIKTSMPPIVIEGRTENHNTLNKDLQNIVEGKYTIKYTSSFTIIYVEEPSDYLNLISSIKETKISYHTYTSTTEKSHVFVLRELTTGITTEQIEEDLMHSYDIKVCEIYQMSTKNWPLFLLVTDPAITLDFLNKNIRVVENIRVVWELRKSTKSIIQYHNCQALGHATANC
ncbi:unnamed protein product [Psylliodes chrysocephalus]|uniref:Uncharacterized protein n=1 Tax=Psylliodes chrysocephalus TaxID=3402493 RepID=A0A9P0GHZ8_9CUCU|nr:unnamed protein product [Psylliodes chrysocephala]